MWCIGNALHVFSQLVVLRQSSSIVTAALLRRQHVYLFARSTCHTQVSAFLSTSPTRSDQITNTKAASRRIHSSHYTTFEKMDKVR